jgi:hypothetical protein
MEYVKNWLLSQGILMLIGLAFIASALITGLIWTALEKVESSKLGTTLKILLCIPAIILGWITIGGMIGLFFRDYPAITELCKSIFEGPWISIVIFKAIPPKGKFAALPFVALYVIWEGYISYLGFFENQKAIFSTTEAVSALLAIISSCGTYWFLRKINKAPNKALEPTIMAVTSPAAQEPRQP